MQSQFLGADGFCRAVLVFEGDESRAETIAICENVAPGNLDLARSACQHL